MAARTWDRTLETGIEDLDAHHRILFDTLSRLRAAAGAGRTAEALDVVYFLRDFCVQHFLEEQELMVRAAYPGDPVHRAAHAEAAREVDLLLDRLRCGAAALTPGILDGLDAWLVKHIREEDFRLAEFLVRAGAPEEKEPS